MRRARIVTVRLHASRGLLRLGTASLDNETFYWLALTLTPGIGATLCKRLLERFKSPESVFRASAAELRKIEGLGEKVAETLQKGPSTSTVEKELTLVREMGGSLLTIDDPFYPKRLKEIYDPPPLLYVRGEVRQEDELAISIVGSRKTSPYGRSITERMSQDLARQGVTIVSGMARGIDSVAHWGAISAGGRTIAVLGCGIDVLYPPENRALMAKIIERGAVLSEFRMGSLPEGGHFPKRNRIISGISRGVVVVQASMKSGSLITARYALDQGRDVYAVPGNVGTESSQGSNWLIKQGAKLVESSQDVLEDFVPQGPRKEKGEEGGNTASGPDLPEEERSLFDLLGDDPLHIDEMICRSRMEPGRVSSLLLNLEIKGLISQWPGKCFTKKKGELYPS
jgi:DNA processing protein